jgi:hypothetical protein
MLCFIKASCDGMFSPSSSVYSIWTFSYCLTFVSRKRTLNTVYVAEQTLRHKMTIKQGYGYFFTLEVDP